MTESELCCSWRVVCISNCCSRTTVGWFKLWVLDASLQRRILSLRVSGLHDLTSCLQLQLTFTVHCIVNCNVFSYLTQLVNGRAQPFSFITLYTSRAKSDKHQLGVCWRFSITMPRHAAAKSSALVIRL